MLYEDVRKEGIALKSGKMKMKKEKEKSEEAAETRGVGGAGFGFSWCCLTLTDVRNERQLGWLLLRNGFV